MRGSGRAMQAEPRRVLAISYLPWVGLPSFVAQPPLPLQEFLPAQPLSPVLQPPLPLQEFLPAQSWVSPFSAARTPAVGAPLLATVVAALSLAVRPPETRPAMAAPTNSALLVDCFFILVWFLVLGCRRA